jgi:transposase
LGPFLGIRHPFSPFVTFPSTTTMAPHRQFGTQISGNARRKQLDPTARAAIHDLFVVAKMPAAEIAAKKGISRRTVYKIIQRFRETGSHKDRPRSGTPHALTDRQKRAIVQAARKEPFRTLNDLRYATDPPPSIMTVSRTLAEANIFSYVAREVPRLTKENMRIRLDFAKKFMGKVNWHRMIFSDEVPFVLGQKYGRQYLRRQPGTEYERGHVREEGRTWATKMFWGAISPDAKSHLILAQGSMDSANYQEVLKQGLFNVLNELETLFGTGDGPTVFFQQDNAPAHTAAATMKFFEEKGINIFAKWPAHSPDLNPIEHAWAMLKNRVYTLIQEQNRIFSQSQASKDEFCELVQKTWEEITQEELRPLILSMDERLDAVIKAKGGHTRF